MFIDTLQMSGKAINLVYQENVYKKGTLKEILRSKEDFHETGKSRI